MDLERYLCREGMIRHRLHSQIAWRSINYQDKPLVYIENHDRFLDRY